MPLSWRIFQSLLWSTQSWTWQFHEIKEQAMNRMTALELTAVCMHAKLFQSCPTLCDPMDYSSPGSSVYGILQARILEWVAIPFSRGSSWPSDQIWVSCIVGRFFTSWATREAPYSRFGRIIFLKHKRHLLILVWAVSAGTEETTEIIICYSFLLWRKKQAKRFAHNQGTNSKRDRASIQGSFN